MWPFGRSSQRSEPLLRPQHQASLPERQTPELALFLGGYLHQDWPEDLEGDPWNAVVHYVNDYGTDADDLASEIDVLLDSLDEPGLKQRVEDLGSCYLPEVDGWTYRGWLAEVATRAKDLAARAPRTRIPFDSKIEVSGGYDHEPQWLAGRDSVSGIVHDWIAGQNETLACVVLLDEPLTATGDDGGVRVTKTGSFLVLQLRYVGQEWDPTGTVHVELCDFSPQDVPWEERTRGVWVESHATYRVLAP